MNLSEVMENINVLQVTGEFSGDVSSICYDSRKCDKNSLFVAITGLQSDGHNYIGEALNRGARFIIHEKEYIPAPGVTAIKVTDSRRALGVLGKNFYHHPSSRLCLIGVTGTNGKTTVTYLLEAILRAAGFSVGILGTVNYRYDGQVFPAPNTTPESFEMQRVFGKMLESGISHVVAEVSSHAVDLRRIDDCAFDRGIFTNLSQDHLDYHGNMENYFRAKKRFFEEVLPAGKKPGEHKMIVNGDDPWGRKLLDKMGTAALTYGIESRCDIAAESFSLSLEGIRANIRAGERSLAIVSPLIGKFNLYNILAAAGAAFSLDISDLHIREGIRNLHNVPGRLEKVSSEGEPAVFVDYAHTDDALKKVLQNLWEFKRGKIITVFGCGGDRDRGKRPLMGEAAASMSDMTIITSDNPRTEDPLMIISEIERGIQPLAREKVRPEDLVKNRDKKCYAVIPDRAAAVGAAVTVADADDIILIAGKGHENYQIMGMKKIPFDDRLVARGALQAMKGKGTWN
ncbi:MAG: UDP-N-acetylmuramoyl-L-alanyl-D-glutamate--2,6-diaminopimelate ligase [Deltaproteobacteria bacterium]|nr:UDP-N-acetylmuramoyl-L-alanyl-D-glutamate--2,6-diaminopimelate ligase [Deltaproteobacteria bacterium]